MTASLSSVIVRSRARDGQILTGDNIQIALDPGLTRTNAYVFMMGPSGGRWDGLRLNNLEELAAMGHAVGRPRHARARRLGGRDRDPVPQASPMCPGQTDWGFDFTRYIRRKAEIVRWSSTNPALELTDVSEAGTLTGITDVTRASASTSSPMSRSARSTIGASPATARGSAPPAAATSSTGSRPALTGTLTFNPDFSDAPLDERQVNTTRFSLFFPETRDFFLQDAGNFEFGGRSFRRTANDRQSSNARPFFSRNLGLVQGKPVSLIAGGKLSGEYGGFNIGALSVLTDETPTIAGPGAFGRARDPPDIFAVQCRLHLHQWRSDGSHAQHRRRRGLPISRHDDDSRQDGRGGSLSTSAASPTRAVTTTPMAPRSTIRTSRGSGSSPTRWSARNFTPALGFVNRRDVDPLRRYGRISRAVSRPAAICCGRSIFRRARAVFHRPQRSASGFRAALRSADLHRR